MHSPLSLAVDDQSGTDPSPLGRGGEFVFVTVHFNSFQFLKFVSKQHIVGMTCFIIINDVVIYLYLTAGITSCFSNAVMSQHSPSQILMLDKVSLAFIGFADNLVLYLHMYMKKYKLPLH